MKEQVFWQSKIIWETEGNGAAKSNVVTSWSPVAKSEDNEPSGSGTTVNPSTVDHGTASQPGARAVKPSLRGKVSPDRPTWLGTRSTES
jgi:hypothetical protein